MTTELKYRITQIGRKYLAQVCAYGHWYGITRRSNTVHCAKHQLIWCSYWTLRGAEKAIERQKMLEELVK